jgi:putative salt-induced outer membrane protein YdiY
MIFLIFPVLLYAQDASKAAEPSPQADTSKPAEESAKPAAKPEDTAQKLGEWWWRNSLTYDPMPTQCLYHGEAKFAYLRETGNTPKENYNVQGLLAFRKERFTGYLQYGLTKEASGSVFGDSPDRRIENFHPAVRYDLTSKLYAQTGALWTKDYDRAIYDRTTYYLGLGYDLIATPKYLLTLFLSGGHEDLEYQEMVTINYMPPGILRNSVYYGDQRFRWGITENIAFNEKFEFVGNVDEGSRYRWTLNLGIEFKLTPYLALRLDYEQKYFNFQPEVYGMDILQKRDQKQGVMIMVSF